MNKLLALAAGLNWKKWLLQIGAVLLLGISLYACGRSDGKDVCQNEKIKQVNAQVKEIQLFVPVVDRQTRVTAETNARLERKQNEYNDEVDKRRRPVDCDLNEYELRSFQQLVEG